MSKATVLTLLRAARVRCEQQHNNDRRPNHGGNGEADCDHHQTRAMTDRAELLERGGVVAHQLAVHQINQPLTCTTPAWCKLSKVLAAVSTTPKSEPSTQIA